MSLIDGYYWEQKYIKNEKEKQSPKHIQRKKVHKEMMADREKVIKAIEICYTLGHNCTECPLFPEDNCNDKLMHDALALLKIQEAVPAIQREVMHMLVWCCGSCGVAITDGDKFCRMCGKPVKWEECRI